MEGIFLEDCAGRGNHTEGKIKEIINRENYKLLRE